MSEHDPQPKRVVVWRKSWLPESETFIRNQIASYTRWDASPHGIFRVPAGLSDPDDAVFLTSGTNWLAERRLSVAVLARLSVLRAKVQRRPDLFHVHFLPDAVHTVRFAQRLRMTTIVTVHGFDVSSWPSPGGGPTSLRVVLRWYRRRAIRKTLGSADAIVAVSEPIRAAAIAIGAPPDRVYIRHIGVPMRDEPGAARPSRDRHGVLFAGRLVPKKGVDHLLRAWSQLPTELTTTPLTILGDGPMREELVNRAKDLGAGVVFRGNVEPDEVRAEMGRAAIMVVPSVTAPNGDMEGLPTVIVEAAASGLPIVAYDHSGVSEAVPGDDHGRVVPEGDTQALAAAITELLQNPQLRDNLAQVENEFIRDNFDIKQCTAGLEDFYDLIAATGGEVRSGPVCVRTRRCHSSR